MKESELTLSTSDKVTYWLMWPIMFPLHVLLRVWCIVRGHHVFVPKFGNQYLQSVACKDCNMIHITFNYDTGTNKNEILKRFEDKI